jgi:hypothetical protein
MDTVRLSLLVVFRDNIAARSAAVLLQCFAVYSVGLVVYRLFLSPLAGFPGSKIAAATHFYEFYYDWWCQGQYIYEIEKMHRRYGLIYFEVVEGNTNFVN